MSKSFDRLAKGIFKGPVSRAFGSNVPAVWISSASGEKYSSIVLFNNPTAKYTTDQVEFVESDPWFEYYDDVFPGLKESVENSGIEEVTVEGALYYVRQVQRLYDGLTFKAHLELV